MSYISHRCCLLGLIVALALGLTGCVGWTDSRNTHASSVMQYLYPTEPTRIEEPAIPELTLPLRVGVAFVPAGDGRQNNYGNSAGQTFTEQQKADLLAKVAARFSGLPYVGKIEIIPSAYLRPGGGFENLRQVRGMFGVDVVALVSYDQVQFTDSNFLSLVYWTIVGAYIVEGERNDTQTLMDAVVYDIESRQMLFRAPGTSQVKASATPINLQAELRTDSAKGFDLATEEMIKNLETELAAFRVRVKERPEEIRIVNRPGYSGAGSFGGVCALALVAAAWWANKKSQA
jgi:rhombotail lipoprotein